MTGATWGDPPVPEVVARLLRERWSVPATDAIVMGDLECGLFVEITSGREVYRVAVRLERGPAGADGWALCLDALDALVGSLEESGRAYRELPQGEGVAHGDGLFTVEVERRVPELKRLADRLLGGEV